VVDAALFAAFDEEDDGHIDAATVEVVANGDRESGADSESTGRSGSRKPQLVQKRAPARLGCPQFGHVSTIVLLHRSYQSRRLFPENREVATLKYGMEGAKRTLANPKNGHRAAWIGDDAHSNLHE
jgi:hypothetical protein